MMRPIEEQPLRFCEEVEMEPVHDEDKLLQLYEAAMGGCLPTLTKLIQNDSHILHRVSLSSKPETPLHISALSGHLEFTKVLLARKPELASRLDSFKCSPLHLASAEGHTQIVTALLRANTEVCLVADAEGRIPLHLAAMRGKVYIIKVLVDAKPDSIHRKLNGFSVLHLCVQYNQVEALKQLVKLVDKDQLLEFRDHGGNIVLHLAVMLRQLETVTYLVSLSEIKANINTLNRMCLSALGKRLGLWKKAKKIKGFVIDATPMSRNSLAGTRALILSRSIVRALTLVLIKAGSRRPGDQDPSSSNLVPPQSQLVPVAVDGETQGMAVNWRSLICWLKGKIKSGYRKCKKHLRHQSDWGH
ncbi:hypothetical protein PTKIN_Ptkin13bG0104200 [Pterospermum kingtungense]